VPAYRGTAYVVIEDLDLARFGNRVPQFSFEVVRPDLRPDAVPRAIRGVAMLPGTGEYSLSTQPRYLEFGPGSTAAVNVNTPAETADFSVALRQMRDELPETRAVSLVLSWFGDDLRAGSCTLRPMVEQSAFDAGGLPWSVAGLSRAAAATVPDTEGRVVYGGTPADAAAIEAIRALKEAGQAVTLYPFILMTQLAGNGLPDPYGTAPEQPPLPWRGRITLSAAPGTEGSPDGTAAAAAEVAAFFGTARAADFAVNAGAVAYSGPPEWSIRRRLPRRRGAWTPFASDRKCAG
jgi:hypothetical protein